MVGLPLLIRLLDELPLGVILLDDQGKVAHVNKMEETLAGRGRERAIGRDFFNEVAPCMRIAEMAGRFWSAIGKTDLDVTREMTFGFPFLPRPRDVRVRMTSFDLEDHAYAAVVFNDLSRERALDRMREQLGQLLVHDLKNPLAVVLANLGFIQIHPHVQPPDIAEALADMQRSAARLQGMILTLLDVTALQLGGLPLHLATQDLRLLAQEAVADAQAIAREYAVVLVLQAPEAGVPAEVDPQLLRRALDNLIENAIRHAPRDSAVIVRAFPADGMAVLEVEDSGPGVPEALADRVFDRFAQLEGGPRESANRGLGLTLVRLAARAHGGEARLVPGQRGARFRIELPEQPAARQDKS